MYTYTLGESNNFVKLMENNKLLAVMGFERMTLKNVTGEQLSSAI